MNPKRFSLSGGRSIPHLARSLDLSEELLWKHIREGRLIATKIGTRTIVLEQDVLAWLDKRETSRLLGPVDVDISTAEGEAPAFIPITDDSVNAGDTRENPEPLRFPLTVEEIRRAL